MTNDRRPDPDDQGIPPPSRSGRTGRRTVALGISAVILLVVVVWVTLFLVAS